MVLATVHMRSLVAEVRPLQLGLNRRGTTAFDRLRILVAKPLAFSAACALNCALVFIVSIQHFLLIHVPINYAVIGLMTAWTFWYAPRAMRRAAAASPPRNRQSEALERRPNCRPNLRLAVRGPPWPGPSTNPGFNSRDRES